MKSNSQNTTAYNQQCYDVWAADYDTAPNSTIAADDLFFPPTWKHLQGKRVLEIGCGTGRHTIRLVAQGNSVTAIDLSEAMLEKARSRIGKRADVHFIQGDFLELTTLPVGSFEAVVTSLVLEHIPELDQFFGKVAVVLRPGGEFFLSEIHPDRIAKGAQANFVDTTTGETIKLASFVHTAKDILNAAVKCGLCNVSDMDVCGTEEIVRTNPEWRKHLGKSMVKMWRFQKSA